MKNGERNAKVRKLYGELYPKYRKVLLKMYLKTHFSSADAEEAAHDFLFHFVEKFVSENHDTNKLNDAYLKSSFKNFVCDSFRKRKPFYFSEMVQPADEESDNNIEYKFDIPGTDNADKLLQSKELKSVIRSCFEKMKKEDVNYLRYRFEKNIPNRKIAILLGQNADYVANKVNRARHAFIKVFARVGYQKGDF